MTNLGRPLKFKDPKAMQERIDRYFAECEAGMDIEQLTRSGEVVTVHRRLPKTMAGLAVALDTSRDALNRYATGVHKQDAGTAISQAFQDVLSRARSTIEQDNITMGVLGVYESRVNTLNLASNFGYSTKSEVKLDANVSLEDALRDLED